ncbi:hypothetical protein CBOM_07767 [Ceraceosorus bombacis]|uniref:Uncharacterized protein n=1 Tax=Ceraceosorus bombacis TaxID=401625 RepID=A0A0P1BN89_9BASI|nr:hypothetical protein CBOM_07767 [Ceraceosorus bombacis]
MLYPQQLISSSRIQIWCRYSRLMTGCRSEWRLERPFFAGSSSHQDVLSTSVRGYIFPHVTAKTSLKRRVTRERKRQVWSSVPTHTQTAASSHESRVQGYHAKTTDCMHASQLALPFSHILTA